LKAAKKWRHNKNQRQIFMERRGGERRPFSSDPASSDARATMEPQRPFTGLDIKQKIPTTATTIEAQTARKEWNRRRGADETWK
jgi:hypothetical protein